MAFSGSGFGSGAAGGAMMGAQVGGPWGAALGGVAGGLLGGLGGKKGTPGQHVQQWLTNPSYSWTEPLYEQQAGFYGDELSRIQRGEAPSYWSGLESSIRGQQQSDLNARYYGLPGDRGGSIMDTAMSAGAQTGTGPRATQANVTKGLRDYSRERQSIESFITQLRANEMQNAYNTIPGAINNIAYGPQGQWDIYDIPGTAGTNPGGSLLQMGVASGGLGSLGGLFGGGGGAAAAPVGGMDAMYGAQDILGRSAGSTGYGQYAGGSVLDSLRSRGAIGGGGSMLQGGGL